MRAFFLAILLLLSAALHASSRPINWAQDRLIKWTFLRPPRVFNAPYQPESILLQTEYSQDPIRIFQFDPIPATTAKVDQQTDNYYNSDTASSAGLPILLYFHGAREAVKSNPDKYQMLADRLNVRLVAVEYQGYDREADVEAKLKSHVSVNAIFSSAQAALKHYVYLKNKNVIVYGSGFGSLVALKALQNLYLTDSAKCEAVSGLILKNPVLPLHSHHSSIQQRLRKYLWDRMLNVFWLKDVCQCETLVLSDRIDQLNAKRTELFAGNRKAEVLISHKKEALIKRMIQFVQSLPINVPKQATGQAAQQGTQQEALQGTQQETQQEALQGTLARLTVLDDPLTDGQRERQHRSDSLPSRLTAEDLDRQSSVVGSNFEIIARSAQEFPPSVPTDLARSNLASSTAGSHQGGDDTDQGGSQGAGDGDGHGGMFSMDEDDADCNTAAAVQQQQRQLGNVDDSGSVVTKAPSVPNSQSGSFITKAITNFGGRCRSGGKKAYNFVTRSASLPLNAVSALSGYLFSSNPGTPNYPTGTPVRRSPFYTNVEHFSGILGGHALPPAPHNSPSDDQVDVARLLNRFGTGQHYEDDRPPNAVFSRPSSPQKGSPAATSEHSQSQQPQAHAQQSFREPPLHFDQHHSRTWTRQPEIHVAER